VAERWEERPPTRFERKGIAAGRPIVDLSYRAVAPEILTTADGRGQAAGGQAFA
jgi:hypothetical protein